MRYANGGHLPPVIMECSSEPYYRKETKETRRMAVGVSSEVIYQDVSIILHPGDAIFLYTDGITEAMDEKDKLFGDKRFLDALSIMKDKSSKEIIDGILREVELHRGKAEQSDDIAMLMVRWGVQETENESAGAA
jgi:sigma-B regulation protein RsbU (phosphoserine phosphatase)